MLARSGFNLCLQVAKNSFLSLRVAPSGLNMMKKTEDALLFSGVETLAPSYNLPGYLVGDVLGF